MGSEHDAYVSAMLDIDEAEETGLPPSDRGVGSVNDVKGAGRSPHSMEEEAGRGRVAESIFDLEILSACGNEEVRCSR